MTQDTEKKYRDYTKQEVSAMLRREDDTEVMSYAVAAYVNELFCQSVGGDVPDYIKELATEGKRYSVKKYYKLLCRCLAVAAVSGAFFPSSRMMYLRAENNLLAFRCFASRLTHYVTLADLQELTAQYNDARINSIYMTYATKLCGMQSGNPEKPLALDGADIVEGFQTGASMIYQTLGDCKAYYMAFKLCCDYFGIAGHVKSETHAALWGMMKAINENLQLIVRYAEDMQKCKKFFSLKTLAAVDKIREEAKGKINGTPVLPESFRYHVKNVLQRVQTAKAFNIEEFNAYVTEERANAFDLEKLLQ